MDIQIINDFDAFADAHQSDIKRLVRNSTRATVFQTWEWCAAWWRHRGGKGRRFCALLFVEQQEIVGAALLWRDPLTAELKPLGDGDGDYLDILALPEHENAVTTALLDWLATDRKRYRLDVRQAHSDGVLATTIGNASAVVPGAATVQLPGEACPALALPATWNDYTKSLGKKRRANIGYYERNLHKNFTTVRFAVATTESLPVDMEAFFALHQQRWNARWLPGAFAGTAERQFHYDAAQTLLAGGFLRLHTLALDGQIQAALYCFHKDTTTYYYLGGFAPELAKYSIGSVLTARAIRHAIEADHASTFDFLRGNESYKYGWGALDRHNAWILAGKRGAGLTLAGAAARATLSAELGLKNVMHARVGGAGAKTKG